VVYTVRGNAIYDVRILHGPATAVTGRQILWVQLGARRRGIVGIHGIGGNVESATYRI
jgi:hypothetical protein